MLAGIPSGYTCCGVKQHQDVAFCVRFHCVCMYVMYFKKNLATSPDVSSYIVSQTKSDGNNGLLTKFYPLFLVHQIFVQIK